MRLQGSASRGAAHDVSLPRTFLNVGLGSESTDPSLLLFLPRSENLARLNGTTVPSTTTLAAATTSAPLISENDLFIKDAFLVFRALCKLSMKPLGADR